VSRNACSTFTLSGPFVQLNPAKDNLSGGGPFNPGQTVSWRLRVRSAPQSSDPAPLAGLVAADLLPVDLLYSPTWTFDDQGTGLPAPQSFEQIPNFAGTGRTLLRWKWNAGSGSLGVNQQVFILFSTTVRSGAAFGPLANTMTLGSDNPGLALRCSGASQPNTLDVEGTGNTSETLCAATGTITVAPIAQLVSSKTIRGLCDGGFGSTSNGTLIGGSIQYQLRVQNLGTVPMQNMVIIDILPFVGDTGVRDLTPRGSQWTPLLAAPILPPAGTTLYYSTSGNPCRSEVGGPVTGCDPPGWTTVPPVPITAVRSFKLAFGSRVVGQFDTLGFTFQLVAPGNTPPGSAFNSFAYQADRSDGLGSLAAEPQKVGVAMGSCAAAALGDYVWVDANGNGLQDDGPTGLNGIFARLYSPGADGMPGTADDVLLSTTVTQQGPANTTGWYSFPGLAPGSYFVCVTPPPTFRLTTPNAGAVGNDSVGNQRTGCSPLVTLAANQQNLTVDFGLLATQLAALGDYVWFDRNADGLQNESTWDGANGVTVKLWADNGNGIAEPGTGDALIATTVTADDVYGRPGYYRFDGLIPGLSYYVQFVLPAAATGFTTQHAGSDPTIDSDAAPANGVSQMVVLAPGEYNGTLDAGLTAPAGSLAIGDQVWLDGNNNGIFEPQSGETGIDNVRLDLYRDANGDGLPTLDEYSGSTFTGTVAGFSGKYLFSGLAAGNYIVVVDPSNFSGSGPLAGLVSSTGNDPAPSPNTCTEGVDKGTPIGSLVGSLQFTLTAGQTNCGDGGPNTNYTVDFGFTSGKGAARPRYDYGDAPDVSAATGHGSYNTTALHNGPYHLLGVPNAPFLGRCVDADSGFNQDPLAKSDDLTLSDLVIGTCDSTGNDEDGVSFTGPFTPGGTAAFTVTAGGPVPCVLNAWVDWNGDGVFGDSAGEQIATNVVVAAGSPVVLTPTVPAAAAPGVTYARFRCSTATGLGPTGPAPDGEVEDYAVSIVGYDYGDAPQSYGTAGAGAARHRVDPLAPPLMLGTCVDTEPDGQPSPLADGDDKSASPNRIGNCFNDEDGVTFPTPLVACMPAHVNVFVTGTGGKLDAWIDFSKGGTFTGAGNQIFTSLPVNPGNNTLDFTVPCSATTGTSYARFRLSSAGGLGPTGTANDGEVEDYLVTLSEHPVIGLAKQLASVAQDPADARSSRVTFAFYVANLGNVALANVNATDSLAATFPSPASYSVISVTSGDFTVNGAFNGNSDPNLLAPGNTLAVGKTGVVQLVVEVHTAGNPGPYSNTSTASATSPMGAPVSDVSQNGTNPDPDGDGSPGNNSDPTVFELPVAIAEIPTLGPAGLAALGALLGLAAWREVRRRRAGRCRGRS
ncbi:MAG TPA: IPTL-CTERM sorting domain-containing protein, partial [Thermoanaerobaculia bacterium]|nr:IPTL-CTERM sorting domain-containing protein [Thermoanaerobaculia bacterium]